MKETCLWVLRGSDVLSQPPLSRLRRAKCTPAPLLVGIPALQGQIHAQNVLIYKKKTLPEVSWHKSFHGEAVTRW